MFYSRKAFCELPVRLLAGIFVALVSCSEPPASTQGSRQITIPPFRVDASEQIQDAEDQNAERSDSGVEPLPDAAELSDAQQTEDASPPPNDDAGMAMGDDAGVEPAPVISACLKTCNDVRDCVAGNGGLYDVDNYQCTGDGLCQWTGCNTDEECVSALNSNRYVCDQSATIPYCVLTCMTADDCVTIPGATGAFDADNYDCRSQKCVYSGCNNNSECATSLGAQYQCVSGQGAGISYCAKSCSAARDCETAPPLYDEDNYECLNGACSYTGCNNDLECTSGFSNPDYVCATP